MQQRIVLIVDDDPAVLLALPEALQLRLSAISVETSSSATDALEKVERHDYDAIVTDIKMPVMDGVALMQKLRERAPQTPTLLMTGHGERDLGIQALKAGAYAFLEKPIDRDFFVAWVERAIQLRQVTRDLEAEKERFRQLASVAPVGIFRTDAKGRCIYVNERWCDIAGLVAEQALGDGWASALYGADRARVVAEWTHAAKNQSRFQSEYRFQRPDGTVTWVFGQAVAERNLTGEIVSYIGTITDITERKVTEQTLRDTELRLQTLFETAQDVIFTLAPDGAITSLNAAFERYTGWSPKEWIGKPFVPLIHPADLPLAIQKFEAVLRGETPPRIRLRVRTKTGGYRLGEFSESPHRTIAGIIGVLGIGRDVTEPPEESA